MKRPADQLRRDALAIFQAGVNAADSHRLVREAVRVDGQWLIVGEEELPLADIGRIVVVGAGKAGAGMAAGLEEALGPAVLKDKQVTGWLNVPADCVRELAAIHLHAARPAGVNEPTAAGVAGAQRISELVRSLGPRDLCLCLISGGGSALLPLPVEGISLADKQALTKLLASRGANIRELNTVRKQLSQIKGGGLARACRAGRLISLIISDVLGDPLDVIASGPTVPDSATPAEALAVLARFDPKRELPAAVYGYLERAAGKSSAECRVQSAESRNFVIGNNALAVDAAGIEAERRGYSHAMTAATQLEGEAADLGRQHADLAGQMRRDQGPDALITGGEPVVTLAPPDIRGRGGRNQQLVLAALVRLLESSRATIENNPADGLVILSGGTDGEDGPTDAAGAILDAGVIARMRELGLDPQSFLARNDAYSFFEQVGGLIKTGPTHTNVCDLRVVLVDRIEMPRQS